MGLSPRDMAALVMGRGQRHAETLFPLPAVKKSRRGVPHAQRHVATGGVFPTRPQRLLACDPSSQSFGWGVLDGSSPSRVLRIASGAFKPGKGKAAGDQYTQILRFLVSVVDRHTVDAIAFEVPSGNSAHRMRGMSAAAYGRAVEIPHALATMRGIPWRAIDVATWKGNVEKAYTAGVVRRLLGYEAASEDEADALGFGIYAVMNA